MRKSRLLLSLLVVLLVLVVWAAAMPHVGSLLVRLGLGPAQEIAAGAASVPLGPAITPLANPDLSGDARCAYDVDLHLTPQQAQNFELVTGAAPLDDAELALLAANGFALGSRTQWSRFVEAYAWIYWKDLPVLVTTDSVLQAVHQSYDTLLEDLEIAILMPQIDAILTATQAQVRDQAAANQDASLDALYQDAETYLAVALALLDGQAGQQDASQWVALANAADGLHDVRLFGVDYAVDFTLFKPRGHYTDAEELQRYFRAMNWLAQIDFRFVEIDPETNAPIPHPQAIAAAAILRDALAAGQQRAAWTAFDSLLQTFVGQSDNMTLDGLDRFWTDMQLSSPATVLAAAPDQLAVQLMSRDYGHQRITGQIIARHVDNASPTPIARPVSFALMGQRFALDSYVLGNLVYDRLMVDGKPIARALPSPLDVMYALGNDRAATHLHDELAKYPYAGNLGALRQQIDALDASYWQTPLYNEWLALIRGLNTSTLDDRYPQAMHTAAWADKMLQTQLASWAQLRHDNLLYVKQSFTNIMIACEYPAGYVEPYPEFYAALQQYAQAGQRALASLTIGQHTEMAQAVRQNGLDYFARVDAVAEQLRTLTEKELADQPFTAEEEAFLKSIVKRQVDFHGGGCGGPTFEEQWDGWYAGLFYARDDNPAVIADVHTNPNSDPQSGMAPPHVATGPAAPLYFLVDTDQGLSLYVGPAFTYFEVIETGSPPLRLDDEAWRQRLASSPYPEAPAWTQSFRPPATTPPQILPLPRGLGVGEPAASTPAPEPSPMAYPAPYPAP